MSDPRRPDRFASRLLQADEPVSEAQYQEYRMNLENALSAAQRREKWAGRLAGVTLVVGLLLLFAGGSKLFGSFDPWSKDATALSVAAGLAYVAVATTCAITLASYYSRFRPATREAKERIRDALLLDLQRQVRELRERLGP
ncbi:MAG: hypothetical protein ACRC33_28520 [Gemmataceae bacterium]